jgi:hypothetical protein
MRKVGAAIVLATIGLAPMAACTTSHPPTDGCTKRPSQEMYQSGMYECPDGTLVFTFATEEARDNWTTTASSFGTVVLGKGTTWVKVRESG